MRVVNGVWDHPKFRKLKKRVGPEAAEYLLRIWGHCETNQKGEVWFGADSEFIEIVANYDGISGNLFSALVECGWVEKIPKRASGVRIHDWETVNSGSVSNWKNGRKGGRPPKEKDATQQKPNDNPMVIPTETKPKPDGNPLANQSETLKEKIREDKESTPISPQGDEEKTSSPDDSLLIRAKSLFTATPPRLPLRLDRSQLLAWKKNKGAVGSTTAEEWALLEEAYAQNDGDAAKFRRKDLAQLLNNWCGEITRAEDWKKKAGVSWRWATIAKRRVVEPEGWQEALAEIYPDAATDLAWVDLSADVRAQVSENLEKKKGISDEQK